MILSLFICTRTKLIFWRLVQVQKTSKTKNKTKQNKATKPNQNKDIIKYNINILLLLCRDQTLFKNVFKREVLAHLFNLFERKKSLSESTNMFIFSNLSTNSISFPGYLCIARSPLEQRRRAWPGKLRVTQVVDISFFSDVYSSSLDLIIRQASHNELFKVVRKAQLISWEIIEHAECLIKIVRTTL